MEKTVAAHHRCLKDPPSPTPLEQLPAPAVDVEQVAADAATTGAEHRAPLPTQPTVHLDRGYDSAATRTALAERGPAGRIADKHKPAPVQASRRAGGGTHHAWGNAFGKLRWCTERRRRVLEFYMALAHAAIVVRRLIRRAWSRYRWAARPRRCP